ncbi:biotin--[acetyl-CoA-carboxylase] ligase [bacterium (Candidatus Blackallbacteria) CG17_big_fil_post_rev_8_21_14_2_50_48_46]|uniref:Biotin--[acetyl-CoA-carboxylase] ligase n=1 Tax=bacterium (Candidatus Blackallbacteria) CG17_big_fil_post_rev_8_21_14_2_50_48_46 TaxID=2014261 RepID=A0A2M7G0D5_9BACT|nr:MAG: biotin--[acetyl-CoA-carboxylase] ligase [bacterium (Candidatus Blackallbacteria) CG18_big_fil_WC_8_21_14_2_50_49_26]PIW15178.1 MAG: biotin--[acetyl-CoA-carboxylase] ligase [bacterium (Candidatus Blackallbacteria) CG17_big_fil_post_rev_8_21_14_2_50_48_46]PIW50145.1 MAG: biotin--[acetyl-CoA-carboxylase] ligase [bacterium (Candidatus Blackallbacteria) CG13_big_fil_rev_8_21_14_2_50_49_14]
MRWQIQSFEVLDSTQNHLRAHALTLPEGFVVCAAQQTQGHGREGRAWFSQPGGLYFSCLLKPAQILPLLPWVLLLAVCQSLEELSGLTLTLKWPNDLLLGGQKLAGMLIDAQIQGNLPRYYVCGVGVNLNQTAFPADLAATSLHVQTGLFFSPEVICEKILDRLAWEYELLCLGPEKWLETKQSEQNRAIQIGYNTQEIKTLGDFLND